MDSCVTCGAERRRVGVLYPARALCPCEVRVCGTCGRPATVVEFQVLVRKAEPKLPDKSGGAALFMCATHAPTGVITHAPTAPAPKKTRGQPLIDPAWTFETPPAGTTSRLKVQCVGCKHPHTMKDRRMFNGTESECPKCRETVTVHADDDKEPG